MTFSIVFVTFVDLFHLLFPSTILTCSSLLQTAQMLFEMILLKFNVGEIHGTDGVFGPLCFILFLFVVVFTGMTMFMSIISDSFCTVQQNSQVSYNEDHQILAFMWKRFGHWTGYIHLIFCLY
jgi:hypothetical protein